MSKGSKRRPEQGSEYLDGWERIWGKKKEKGSSKVEEYRAMITKQFDELEEMMKKQMHLTNPEEVENKLYSVNYKWHFISEEDRDFYQGCKYALEHGLKW